MAASITEQLGGYQRYSKKEAKAYDDTEKKEAASDSQPRDGESYLLLTPYGKRSVTFTTYGVETTTKTRSRKRTVNKP